MPWVAVPANGDGTTYGGKAAGLLKQTVRISYSVTGRGPVLAVLIPGLCVPRVMYDNLVARLAEDGRYTAVCVDNRGMGESGFSNEGWNPARLAADAWAVVDDARAALVHSTLSRVALVGHSMGGMIIQRMAVQRPTEVGLLALLSTHAGGAWNLIPSIALLKALLTLAWHKFEPHVRAGVSIGLHYTDRFLDSVSRRRADFMRRYMAGAETDFSDSKEKGNEQVKGDFALRGHLSVVRAHSLRAGEAAQLASCDKIYKIVLAGRSDCVIVPSASRRLANAIASNIVIEVEGAHFVFEEAEDTVISNVLLGLDVAFGSGANGEGRIANDCACDVCMPEARKQPSCFENFRMC